MLQWRAIREILDVLKTILTALIIVSLILNMIVVLLIVVTAEEIRIYQTDSFG